MRNGGVIVDRTIASRKERNGKKGKFIEFLERTDNTREFIDGFLLSNDGRFIFSLFVQRDILEGKILPSRGNDLSSLTVFSRKYFH